LPEASFDIDDISIRLLPARRSGSAIGIRLGDALAYITDTKTDSAVESFARGCHFLLKDVPLPATDYTKTVEMLAGDPGIRGVLDIAIGAAVKCVAPINLKPSLTEDDLMRASRALTREGIIGIGATEGTIMSA